MNKDRVVAIVQARSGSSRFPGKVLTQLAGFPLIWHVFRRLGRSGTVDEAVLATTVEEVDDKLCSYAESLGIKVIRGPEDDVLERFRIAVEQTNPDWIVRVTGDAPLVDPESLDGLVEEISVQGGDFCVSDPKIATINEGFEVASRAALDRLFEEKKGDPVAKEHTLSYFKLNPGFAKIVYDTVPEGLQFSGARVSVDTPSDLQFLEAVYARLGASAGELDLRELVSLLKKCPELLQINSAVVQKKADVESKTVVFRCDAGSQVGYGHLFRSMAVAEAARSVFGIGPIFCVRGDTFVLDQLSRRGFRTREMREGEDTIELIKGILANHQVDALFLDVRDDLSRDQLSNFKSSYGVPVLSLDDPEDKRLECDLVVYPPVPQVQNLNWAEYSGEKQVGWDWVALREEFAEINDRKMGDHSNPSAEKVILISMGGADPHGMLSFFGKVIEELQQDFSVVYITGGNEEEAIRIQDIVDKGRGKGRVIPPGDHIMGMMESAVLAIVPPSMLAFELACVGCPALYVAFDSDLEKSSEVFVRAGVGKLLGFAGEMDAEEVGREISQLIDDEAERRRMSEKGSAICDGKGTHRIAEKLEQMVRSK